MSVSALSSSFSLMASLRSLRSLSKLLKKHLKIISFSSFIFNSFPAVPWLQVQDTIHREEYQFAERTKCSGTKWTSFVTYYIKWNCRENKKESDRNPTLFCYLPAVGLEPTRGCPQQILSLPRLPFRHAGICEIIYHRLKKFARRVFGIEKKGNFFSRRENEGKNGFIMCRVHFRMRTWEDCECSFCITDTMTERKNSGILYVETFCFLKRDLGDCYEHFLSGHMC